MNKADIFVLLINVQFEKNGWQNRCQVNNKYWTMPVKKGNVPIREKHYTNGSNLVMLNEKWIAAIAETLNINYTKVRYDFPTEETGTERIVELCYKYDCDKYLTNPEAMDKYLDDELMHEEGIEIVNHNFPYKLHVFEAFQQFGIEGTRKLLEKEKKRCIL